jgi:hypothetical protein
MSQHYFDTTWGSQLISILMGWDRPLQGYFMVIESPENDEPLWCNLSHEPSHPDILEPFLAILADLNITIPLQMIQEILEDGAKNVGNKQVRHSLEDGIYARFE